MEHIIIYSTDEIDFNKLKSFQYKGFISIAYGKINNKFWFVYGSFNHKVYNPESQRLEGMAAFEHITKKAISSSVLLQICDSFGEYINNNNTDIEVKGIGKGSLIEFVEINIINLSSGKKRNDDTSCLYRQ